MKEIMQEHSGAAENVSGISRRKFLTYAGGIAGAGLLIASCSKNDDTTPAADGAIDVGGNDKGVLNYFYALEQMQAYFYMKVCDNFYQNLSQYEYKAFQSIRDHEITHREFLKNLLGTSAIRQLEFDFGSVDFTSRTSVLNTARAIEDISVAAYNGGMHLFTTPSFVVATSKMASVEARHCSLIHDLLTFNNFSEGTDANGTDPNKGPAEVVAATSMYFKTKISVNNLPTT